MCASLSLSVLISTTFAVAFFFHSFFLSLFLFLCDNFEHCVCVCACVREKERERERERESLLFLPNLNFHELSGQELNPDHTPSAGAPYPLQDEHPSFVFPPIHSHEVLKELQHLSPHKASGCTAISNRVLRETAPVIASSLTHIYNLSLTTATFPSDWKRAIVCPIFKNRGEKSDPSNYRPISLLPAVGKVFDKLQSHSLHCVSFSRRTALSVTSNLDFCRGGRP